MSRLLVPSIDFAGGGAGAAGLVVDDAGTIKDLEVDDATVTKTLEVQDGD